MLYVVEQILARKGGDKQNGGTELGGGGGVYITLYIKAGGTGGTKI